MSRHVHRSAQALVLDRDRHAAGAAAPRPEGGRMTRDAMLELAAILTAAGDSIRALCEPSLLVTAPTTTPAPTPFWPHSNVQEAVDDLRRDWFGRRSKMRSALNDAARAEELRLASRVTQGIRPPARLHVVRDTPEPGPNAATLREYSPTCDHHCPRDGEPYCCSAPGNDSEACRRHCLSMCAEDDHAPVLSPDWSHPEAEHNRLRMHENGDR